MNRRPENIMAQEIIKISYTGDSDADEAMRKVRKNVVSSLVSDNPRRSAAIWARDKDAAAARIED